MSKTLGYDGARHLLARTGFGPRHAEVTAFSGLTPAQAADRLLGGARTAATRDAPSWGDAVPLLAEARMARMKATSQSMSEQDRRATRQKLFAKGLGRAVELKGWWFQEMIHTPSPLTERMTLFWHNHFTSSVQKVKSPALLYRQNATLRRHALGNFRGLLREIARDPAMIVYLDGLSNRKGKPNENFAREVLELFTLGEGHYTEQDIKEAARAFTGWTLDPRTGEFLYARRRHDGGVKTFLGERGRFDGDDILELLLAQPRTAVFLTEKLWRELIATSPDAAEVERVAGVLRASKYQIKPWLRAMLTSRHFLDASTRGRRVKSPVELLVGTVRVFGVEFKRPEPLIAASRRLGQDILDPPNVKGWEGETSWITTDTLLARQQMIDRIFRDPGLMPDLARGGFSALLDARMAKDRERRADATRRLLLPVAPIFDTSDVADDAFELSRALALDPSYQLC